MIKTYWDQTAAIEEAVSFAILIATQYGDILYFGRSKM